jgi:hypothetical protein
VIAVVVSCGCDSGPDYVIEVGDIVRTNGIYDIHTPTAVAVGADAALSVTTLGGGCVTLDSTAVQLDSAGADITPYDLRRIPGENEGCILIAVPLVHEALVHFDEAGAKTLRFHGRRMTSIAGEPVEERYDVVVDLIVE